MIEQTLDDYLDRMATFMDDFSGTPMTTAADGRLGRDRCVSLLNAARRQIMREFLTGGVSESIIAELVQISADSSDTDKYPLPKRTLRLCGIFDGDDNEYLPVYSRHRMRKEGYIVEPRAIRWFIMDPPDVTLYALVVREPARMTQGTAEAASSTSLAFMSSATLGDTIVEDDYYNGCRVAIVGGTGANQTGTISDFVGSTRVATTGTWGTTPSTDSVYCLMDDFPRCATDAVVLRACVNLCRADATWRDVLQLFYGEYQHAYSAALNELRLPTTAIAAEPRRAVLYAK